MIKDYKKELNKINKEKKLIEFKSENVTIIYIEY